MRDERPGAVARAGGVLWAPMLVGIGIAVWFAAQRDLSPGLIGCIVLGLAFSLSGALILPRLVGHDRITAHLAGPMRSACFAVALVLAGVTLTEVRAMHVDAPVIFSRYYGAIEGRVTNIDRSASDRLRITLDQVVLPGRDPKTTPRLVRLSLMDGTAPPSAGQRVMTTGYLGPPPEPAEPGGYDFRRAAWFQGLGGVGYSRNPVLVIAAARPGMALAAEKLRTQLAAGMAERIGGQSGAVAAALMTGDRSHISEATNQMMRDSNLYHIVSISGLHMAMLAGFVVAALRYGVLMAQVAFPGLLAIDARKVAAFGALMAATVYLWLSGADVPTQRAYVTVAVMLVAMLLDRRAISLRTVALAALMILALTPEALVTPGFQMSFAATVALVILAGPWARWTRGWNGILRAIAMLFLSSLIASLATGPIAAAHFGRMSQYGVLANMAAVPVMGGIVMPAGVIAAVLAPVGLAGPALWVMGIGTAWMLAVAEFVAGLGGAVMAVPAPPPAVLPLFICGAIVVILIWPHRGLRVASVVTGGALIIASFGLWVSDTRPALLINGEGTAVGVMTAAGRSLSKPGQAFTTGSWLKDDGDTSTPEMAADRAGWTGPSNQRQTMIAGTPVVHVTGKGAATRAADACKKGAIIVTSVAVDIPAAKRNCQMFDKASLGRTGSVRGDLNDGRLITTTTDQLTGDRGWTAKARPYRAKKFEGRVQPERVANRDSVGERKSPAEKPGG
ncbi:MAG: competence protein ComEC [Paracoccus denitrificans]|nr:MAG: competence protein ComEC [Paracoccus denitrificans]PZO83511.1 MAG: competence protein ComEC [Paracoccus denitrificans]